MNINKNSTPSDKAAHEVLLSKFLSLKSVGLVIVVGIVVISISTFVDSVTDLVAALPKPEATISAYDTKTQEETLSTAKKIDVLFSNIIHSNDNSYGYTSYRSHKKNYRLIDIELQNLLLRQESRPLNKQSVKYHKLVMTEFSAIRKLHKNKSDMLYATAKGHRKSFHALFKLILSLEATKPKT